MDKFVCVRVVQGWGMDLSLFQFDYDLTFSVLFMNADKSLYGRYSSRSSLKDASKDISLESLKKALEGALELHAGYPGNKKDLAAKSGPKALFPTPESIPEIKARPNTKPADGTRAGCVHCHQAHDGEMWALRNSKQPLPDKLLFPYPMPDVVGLSLDPKERAAVVAVEKGSAADKAGFKAGDKITKLEGQPIISIADVQWVLHNAKDAATLKAEVDRGGKKTDVSLALGAGWRQRNDYTWREWTWALRHKLMGTEPLKPAADDEKKQLGVPDKAMAIKIDKFPPDFVKEKNAQAAQVLKAGDVIIEVDGRKDLDTEGEFLAYLMQKKAPGMKADLTVIRGGKPQKLSLTIP